MQVRTVAQEYSVKRQEQGYKMAHGKSTWTSRVAQMLLAYFLNNFLNHIRTRPTAPGGGRLSPTTPSPWDSCEDFSNLHR